jgi:hypothetical protein
MHSAAGLLCSTVFVTFVLWLWMGATGCRGVGFGSLFCSLGLGGLGGGQTPLGSDLNRQFLLAALSSRMSCMNSLNSDIFAGLILFALTWLSALMQLSKQWPQIFQRGHILQFSSQWTLSETCMLAKSFAHVLSCLSLNSWHGEELFTLLFIFFPPGLPFPPCFFPPGFLASSAGPFLGASLFFGAVKDKGSFSSKVPKRTCSMRPQKLRIVSSTLVLIVAVMQSSNHSWKRVSTAYMNLQQNFWSACSLALNANLHFSVYFMSAVIAW